MDRPRFWRLANSQDWCHCAHFTFSEWDYFYQEFPFDYTIRNLFCTHTETDIFFSMNAFERRFCSVTKQARCQLLQSPRDGKNRNKSRMKYLQNVVWQQSGFRLYFLGENRILLFSAFLRAWIKWPENCCLFYFETDRFSLFINWCNRLAQDFYPNLSSFFVFSRKSIVPMLRIKGGENLPGCIKRWRYLLLTKRTTGGLWIGLL